MTGVYVHVPFCVRACPYCDFDFEVGARPDGHAFVELLARELAGRADEHPLPPVATVYVGGGTPTALAPAQLLAALEQIAGRVRAGGDDAPHEWTVEANPEHIEAHALARWRALGVTRVSLGVQSLVPRALTMLGRAHTPAVAAAAVKRALAAGLRVSADLILGWPGQRDAEVDHDVDALVDLGVEHVSVYALELEPHVPWMALVRRGARALPDADASADRWDRAIARLTGAGFDHYEIASFARPGAAARHNVGYWTWRDYEGYGPSAHGARYGATGVQRRANPRGLAAWRSAVLGESAQVEREDVPAEAAAVDGLWTALRLREGLPVPGFLARFPAVDAAWLAAVSAPARTAGLLELVDAPWPAAHGEASAVSSATVPVLRATAERWRFHDAIARSLVQAAAALTPARRP